MKLTSISHSLSSYDTVLEERIADIGQCQALYWESFVTLGLFILAILVLL
ncbi:MAG: hypothetical protein ACO3EZ_13960 [Prochlorotrichaceae cyanobacterium]